MFTDRSKKSSRLARSGLVAAAVGGMLTLAACGGGSAADDEDGGTVTLRFSWWGSDERHEMTQELIDMFEEKNPDIKIEGEYTGWDDYWDRLATSVAGRKTPDIMQHETRYIREYADRGALAELDDYLGEEIDTSRLDESVASAGEIDGKTYAIPTGINAYTVVLDKDLYEEAGVEIPDDETWTWDDMIKTSAEVTKKTGEKVYGIQDMGFVDAGLEVFARQHGESIFTPDGGLGLSDQTLKDWWNTILEMRDQKAEPKPSLTIEAQSGGIDQGLLATNKGAGGFWWTNEFPTLVNNSGHELTMNRFPGESGQPGMFLKPAMFWAVSAQSEHPEEAAKFVDFLLNDPDVAKRQLSDRGLPLNLDRRDEVVAELDPADGEAADFLTEITPDLADPPVLPPKGAGEVQAILAQLNEQLLFDQISVDEAVQRFRSEVESAIS